MDKTQKLKKIILSRYNSVREFSKLIDIPSTTLNSALEKGIGGMGVDRVLKICDELNIDVKTFNPICQNNLSNDDQKLLDNFNKLNDVGKQEAIKRVAELTFINAYTHKTNEYLTEYGKIDTLAAHNDFVNNPGELEKIMEDFEEMDRW